MKRKLEMTSFIAYEKNCDFPIQNLPYGIFSLINSNDNNNNKQEHANEHANDKHIGVAIGDKIFDLHVAEKEGLFDSFAELKNKHYFSHHSLNAFMNAGKRVWSCAREAISDLLSAEGKDSRLRANADLKKKCLVNQSDVKMHLPCNIGDYTDFYASRQHATNIGAMWRSVENALLPNWLHLPVGYHGRASSVVVSGTPIRRPCGQLKADDASPEPPVFAPCKNFDFELEMGFFFGGPGNELGDRITTAEARDRIFGVCILNDWSARDIQKWEYVPLGPFLAKNLGTTISPWVVTMDALEPFFIAGPDQSKPQILPYLQESDHNSSLNVNLEVAIKPSGGNEYYNIVKSNMKNLYWSAFQMVAHHTCTGCNMCAGDLFGSGTISGDTPDSFGSMVELCWKGTKPITLSNGEVRKFIQDGDSIKMTAFAQGEGYRIGFGNCEGTILPAKL